MCKLLLIAVFLFCVPLPAVEIDVGGVRINLPVPNGYRHVTPNMQPHYTLGESSVPPSNVQYAQFLPAAVLEAPLGKEVPEGKRRCYVQAVRQLSNQFATKADYATVKAGIKEQNASMFKEVQKKMPELTENMSKDLSKVLNTKINLSINNIVPLPPFFENERALAYSMLMKVSAVAGAMKQEPVEVAVSMAVIHVKGRVLFLYSAVEKAALQLGQDQLQKWTMATLAANPSTGEIAEKENKGKSRATGGVSGGAIIGAVVGGIVGLLSMLRRKKREE